MAKVVAFVAATSLLIQSSAVQIRGRLVFVADVQPSEQDIARMQIIVTNVEDAGLQAKIAAGLLPDTLPPPSSVTASATFEVRGLRPGQYTVRVARVPKGFVLRSGTMGDRDVVDTPFTIGSESVVKNVVLTFSDRPTGIEGRLTTPTGSTAGYTVVVFAKDPGLWTASSRRTRFVGVAGDGTFVVKDLPAGDYFVASVAGRPSLTNAASFEELARSSVRVSLLEGEQKRVEIRRNTP